MFTHGSKASLWLHDGTTLVDVSSAVTSASLERSRETAETTAFGDTAKEYIAGLKDATLSFEGNSDQAIIDSIVDSYDQDAPVAFEYYPEGKTTGKPKESGNCIVTSVSEESPVDDKNSFSAEVQVTGAVTRGVAA